MPPETAFGYPDLRIKYPDLRKETWNSEIERLSTGEIEAAHALSTSAGPSTSC